jgi:hypothetical protein
MFKKMVVLIVLLGFAWSYPPLRAKVAHAASPALELLGPVGYRMQQPMRKYQAETDVKFLVDQLQMARTEGRSLPSPGTSFNEWMLKRKGAGDRGRDPWGNHYWLLRSESAYTVVSSGPDGEKNTPDDIRRTGIF